MTCSAANVDPANIPAVTITPRHTQSKTLIQLRSRSKGLNEPNRSRHNIEILNKLCQPARRISICTTENYHPLFTSPIVGLRMPITLTDMRRLFIYLGFQRKDIAPIRCARSPNTLVPVKNRRQNKNRTSNDDTRIIEMASHFLGRFFQRC